MAKKAKGKIVAKDVFDRKPNHLYYTKGDSVYEVKMNRKGAKKNHKTCK